MSRLRRTSFQVDNNNGFSKPTVHSHRGYRPTNPGTTTFDDGPQSPSKEEGSPPSVRLSCLSPEGKQWHSVVWNQGKYILLSRAIEEFGDLTQRPLMNIPPVVEVVLPETVQAALSLDPPLELFCVEAEGTELKRLRLRVNDNRIGLQRLCLYSRSSLFVIQCAFDGDAVNDYERNNDETTVCRGEVVSVQQPFENYFLKSGYSTYILRVRAAPQRWMGHAVHSPSGCLTMLTEDRANREYQLVCLECNGELRNPTFSFGLEQIAGGSNRIVDFCFAQSTGLPLLSSMSVLLLKASGDVLAASPFVFNGSLVPRIQLEESLEFLQDLLDRLDRSHPKWRQCRAAQQFLSDVFPRPNRQTQFVAAKTASKYNVESASGWPLRLQGPIIIRTEDEDAPSDFFYSTIENFGKIDLVGFAIGGSTGCIEFGVTSPTTILPRFALESRNDSLALDDLVVVGSAWVEKVGLGLESIGAGTISLYQDPNYDSILHVVSSTLVASIYSNCISCASSRVRGDGVPVDVSTEVWSNLENPSQYSFVQGVVGCANTVSGHKLLIQISDGNVQIVNVSQKKESRDLRILQTNCGTSLALLLEAPTTDPRSLNVGRISDSLRSNVPFHETASSHIAKVNKGLASLAKLVGSQTQYDEISLEMLAVVASIKERCENEIVLPVLELAKMVKNRRKVLLTLLDSQAAQISKLMEMRDQIELGNKRIRATLAAAEANALNLKDRTNKAYEACKNFTPTITVAEEEFFSFVERMDLNAKTWESKYSGLNDIIRERCTSVVGPGEAIREDLLDSDIIMDFQKINNDTERRLNNTQQILKETDLRLNAELRKAGHEAPS